MCARALAADNPTSNDPGSKPGPRPRVFISVKDDDKPVACIIARRMRAAGYEVVATRGTAAALQRARIPAEISDHQTLFC